MKTDPNNSWQILEMMDSPIFLHDSQFRLIFANLAYYREAGVTKRAALGKPYWEVFPKGTGPLPNCKKKTHKHSKGASLDECTVGNTVYLSQGYQTTIDLMGTKGFLHVLTDISKSSVLEKAFEKMASQFQVLFETSPDAIMLLDEKAFFECNPATLTMFGCKNRSEFIGKHPSQFSPRLQPNGIDSMVLAGEHIGNALKDGHHLFEWEHCRLDGSVFPAEVLLLAFKRDGKTVLQATVRDITVRKHYERLLEDEAQKLSHALTGTVNTMSKAMELRDPYTAGHQSMVSIISCAIATEMGWDDDRITGLRMAALIHDIGKIGVPSEILTKASVLSEFERKLVELHAQHGYELLKDIEFPWPIAKMVHQHHERMDGSGYPLGLKGDEICPEARVLAVADMIDAISSHRPYRAARGLPFAIEEIKEESGKQLDAKVVDVALRLFEGKASLDMLDLNGHF